MLILFIFVVKLISFVLNYEQPLVVETVP